jgi:hypothetical protein
LSLAVVSGPSKLWNHNFATAFSAEVGGRGMQDQNMYRQSAAECLEIASITTDREARARLVVLASKFLDLASKPGDYDPLRVLIDEFNDSQMRK